MHLEKDASILHRYHEAIKYEWLETNGLGGYRSSTIIGCNERRYHGLLIAATTPPTERKLLLSKLDETVITARGRFPISTNNYGDTIHPTGFQCMTHFRKVLFPEFLFEVDGVDEKTAKASLMLAGGKLPIKVKIIKRRDIVTL